MIHKEKENVVFSKSQTIEDILDHFKSIDKKQIHTLKATFTSDLFIYEKLQQIFEDNLFKGQENLKRLKIRFDATPLATEDLQSLNKFIVRLKSVRHLQLSFGFCNLTLPCLNSLVEGILALQELKGLKLDLSGNPILSKYNYILKELMKVPSKYFKLKMCQCDLNILMFSVNSKAIQQSSGYALRESTSSNKQENQKQGNQQTLQNQQHQQSQRQSRRSSSNVNQKEDVSNQSNKRELTQGSTIGIFDQKNDRFSFNQAINQRKMLFQNIQVDQGDQNIKNAAQIKNVQNDSSDYQGGSQQAQIADKVILTPNKQSHMLDNGENLDQKSQNIAKSVHKADFKELQDETEEQQEAKNKKQQDGLYQDFKVNQEQTFLNSKIDNQKNGSPKIIYQSLEQVEVEFKMDIEEDDYQQYQKLINEHNEDEDEFQQYDNINQEEFDEENNQFAYKKGKFLKKNQKPSNDINTNVKTRSKKGIKTISKKDQHLNKLQNNSNQKLESSKNNSITQTHSKTAGKGEAYFNRTYRGNNNITHGGLSKMNTNGNEQANSATQNEYSELNKTENLDTLVNSLQFQRQSSLQQFQIDHTQNSNQNYFLLSKQIQNKSDLQNQQNPYVIFEQQTNVALPVFQQGSRKYQKRVIDKIVLDFRSNQDLQQQSLKILALSLNEVFSQVNELHLKVPDSEDWNNLITLEFSTCLPIVLDVRIDPICFQKVAFTNMNKEISTAFRKLKFGDRLKDNPNTQQIQEEIQNWFCPEKDFVCKKSLVKENYIESSEMNHNIEQIEFENFRYQQIFFSSPLHQFCNICQNYASELHFLQANTQGLYFCYSQEDIPIIDFLEFLDKVQINLQNQYSQIFNEGEIRENLCSNQQLYLFQHFLNRQFTNYNDSNQKINNYNKLIDEEQNKIHNDLLSTPKQQKNKNVYSQSESKQSQTQEQVLTQSAQFQSSNISNSNIYYQHYHHHHRQQQQQQQQQQFYFQFNQTNHFKSNHMSSYYVSQEDFKYNNFHKKLERALKLKLIECVTIRFIFQEYYYEEQYELVQKIFNMIKIISQRININKLYLSVQQGISPLILSQIIFVEELNIDLIEAGSCLKDKNIFYVNLRNPKFQILKPDLQIFAQIINSNASFEEIHINFDERQIRCIQSISHLLTRYRQEINLKEQTLTIYRENLPPISEFPSSVCQYLDIIDESGNFNDKEEETTQSPQSYNKHEIFDDLEQEEKSESLQNSPEQNIQQQQDRFIKNIQKDQSKSSQCNNLVLKYQSRENLQNSFEFQNNLHLSLQEISEKQHNEERVTKIEQENEKKQEDQQQQQQEQQFIEQESQQLENDVTQNLSVSKKRERKRQTKNKNEQNQEQKQVVQEKAISKKRNQDKDEKKKLKAVNQRKNTRSKKGKNQELQHQQQKEEEKIKSLNSENEQDQKSSSINDQQDDENIVDLKINQINTPNNNNNNNNNNINSSKGDQYLNINGKQQILKQDQSPQQLLY